jgi:hypothetical protein
MKIKKDSLTPSGNTGILFPDGSTTIPSISWQNESNTGLYRESENKISISVGGSKVGTIGSDYGAFRGNVVQCLVNRYDTQTTVTTGTSSSGIEITGLRVTITPKFSNSLIVCQFQIHGEGASTHNFMYNVYKDGIVPTGNYAGFNTIQGDNIWSGISMALPFESDYSNTPYTKTFLYHDYPGTTSAIIYAPGVKSTNGSSYIYYINRAVSGTGSSEVEAGVSYSMIWEIAQ